MWLPLVSALLWLLLVRGLGASHGDWAPVQHAGSGKFEVSLMSREVLGEGCLEFAIVITDAHDRMRTYELRPAGYSASIVQVVPYRNSGCFVVLVNQDMTPLYTILVIHSGSICVAMQDTTKGIFKLSFEGSAPVLHELLTPWEYARSDTDVRVGFRKTAHFFVKEYRYFESAHEFAPPLLGPSAPPRKSSLERG